MLRYFLPKFFLTSFNGMSAMILYYLHHCKHEHWYVCSKFTPGISVFSRDILSEAVDWYIRFTRKKSTFFNFAVIVGMIVFIINSRGILMVKICHLYENVQNKLQNKKKFDAVRK